MPPRDDAGALSSLEPAVVWSFFSRIAAVPRPSRNEVRIRLAVRSIAQEHGLNVREDAVGNLVIDVPAASGCESAPVTILQGHLDMVCEKNASCTHDFDRDPIRLLVDRDAVSGERIVRADGTTLGADNGIGVAMAFAAAVSADVTRGPLELLFTVDEESGMTGAKALMPESLRGRRLLNLDSEEDGVLYIGCAGGCDATLSWDFKVEPAGEAAACRVWVSGLRGGHSGSDIHENRGNAIKLLARTLLKAHPEPLRIASIDGGKLRNAIPREAAAVVAGPTAAVDALKAAARQVADEAAREYAKEEPDIRVERISASDVTSALSPESTGRVLATLTALPHGVLGMHNEVSGLVETSNNIASVTSTTGEGGRTMRVAIGALARSSSASSLQATLSQIAAAGRLAGATYKTGNDYPGWEPKMDSPTLTVCRRVYKELFGEDVKVAAIHAGLECGIIGERVGGMDMVSLGPRIEGAHTPGERVYVASVQKSWKYLQAVLADLALE